MRVRSASEERCESVFALTRAEERFRNAFRTPRPETGSSGWSPGHPYIGASAPQTRRFAFDMDVSPIVKVFDALLGAGAAVAVTATAFFIMLSGFQYMTAGGSVRGVESAKSSLFNALIGLAIVILCKIISGLVGSALGAPSTGATTMLLAPIASSVRLLA
jgi:hypothetical protein